MKITRVKFKSSNQPTTGVRSSMGYMGLGDACDPQWGGGTVGSMYYDRTNHSLAVRKADGAKFERAMPAQQEQMPTFDVLLIPWDNIDFACGCDEAKAGSVDANATLAAQLDEAKRLEAQQAEKDPPPAKPIQQQGRGR